MILLEGGGECRCGYGVCCCFCDYQEEGILPKSHGSFCHGRSEAQTLSDPLFNQKDLFAPASIEAARKAARDVSLYRGAQSRPSTSSGMTQRRSFSSSSSSRGRPHSSPLSTPQRSPAV